MPIMVMGGVGLNGKLGFNECSRVNGCLRVGGTELSMPSVGMKAFGCPSSIINVWGILSSEKKKCFASSDFISSNSAIKT